MGDSKRKDQAVEAFSRLYQTAGNACDSFLVLMEQDAKNAELALSRLRADWPARALGMEPNIADKEERLQLFSDFLAQYQEEYGLTIRAIGLAVFLIAPLKELYCFVQESKTSTLALMGAEVTLGLSMLDATRVFLTKKKKEANNVSAASSRAQSPRTPLARVISTTTKIPSSLPTKPPISSNTLPEQDEGPSGEKRKASSPASGGPKAKKTAVADASSSKTPPSSAQKTSPVQNTPPAAAEESPKRKRSATEATYRRDGNMCILTGNPRPDGAHIFPFSGTKDVNTMAYTFRVLKIFWGTERADEWKAQCENLGITESPKNILSLSKTMHGLWGDCAFGLKPVSKTSREVLLQFHWLHRGPVKPLDVVSSAHVDTMVHDMVGGQPHGFAESHIDNDNVRGRNDTISHRLSGQRLESGQVFAVQADNEEDLPSMELLQLQWDLMRVGAMCGAADVLDEAAGRPDEGEDDYGILEATVEDDDVEPLALDATVGGHGMDEMSDASLA